MDKYMMFSVSIIVSTFSPLSAGAAEIEDILSRNGILFKQTRTSPVSITYLTTTDPSNALDPYISDNLSCVDSFQVYRLDDAKLTPSNSCKVYYSFLSIKFRFFSNLIVETKHQSLITPPIRRKQAKTTGPTRRPSPLRQALANRGVNSKRNPTAKSNSPAV
ncbi:hypothetical protein Vi05172_g9432 [Venturia inaequalis]|nr:hypothetical protein Vi05172_g9432 [Venturia inaequalis]